MPADRQPRSVARGPDPAELEQADDPGSGPAVGLEQFEHPGVVAAGFAGQRERDEVREVEVADADGILVAQDPDAHLGRGPRADPGHGLQSCIGVGQRQVHDRLEPGRTGGDPPDQVGAAAFDTERVVGVVRGARQASRPPGRRAGAIPPGREPARRALGRGRATPDGPPGR